MLATTSRPRLAFMVVAAAKAPGWVGTRQCTANSEVPKMDASRGMGSWEVALMVRTMPLRMM